MSAYPPLHFRKLPTTEETSFAQLPLYTRGLGKMLLTYCDDQGRIALGKRSPADAVAWRCGADRNDRRMLAKDLQDLVEVGYIRIDATHIIVLDQERDWKTIESVRSSRPFAGSKPRSHRPTAAYDSDSNHTPTTAAPTTTRNDSSSFCREEKTKEREEKKRSSPIGEGVQGEQSPKTDPTPSLLGQKLDQAIGKGPASWGMDESGAHQNDLAKAQTPTPVPPAPSPLSPHQGPSVPVVDPKPVPGQIPPAKGVPDRPVTLVDIGPPTNARKAPAKRPTAKKPITPAGERQPAPCPVDFVPNEAHYAFGRELGLQKKHVDYFAGEMRDRAESDGWLSGNWNAKFRNYMRIGLQFLKGVPPIVPEPLPPKVPMPPCPPPSPEVLARAQVWKERMEAGETIDIKSLFKPKYVVPPVKEFGEEFSG